MTSGPTRALVTGANRGLGLALATALLDDPRAYVACAVRDLAHAGPCRELLDSAPGQGMVVRLDHDVAESVPAAAARLKTELDGLDILINCGGRNTAPCGPAQWSKGPLAEVEPSAIESLFRTNVIGPMLVSRELRPLLTGSRHPVIVNVSTSRASLSLVDGAGSLGYAVTKAALNMLTRKIAAEFAVDGIVVVAVDPGWVRTRMGGQDAPTSPGQAARELLTTVDALTPGASGSFLTRSGEVLPW